jgi:hypothetical protein
MVRGLGLAPYTYPHLTSASASASAALLAHSEVLDVAIDIMAAPQYRPNGQRLVGQLAGWAQDPQPPDHLLNARIGIEIVRRDPFVGLLRPDHPFR